MNLPFAFRLSSPFRRPWNVKLFVRFRALCLRYFPAMLPRLRTRAFQRSFQPSDIQRIDFFWHHGKAWWDCQTGRTGGWKRPFERVSPALWHCRSACLGAWVWPFDMGGWSLWAGGSGFPVFSGRYLVLVEAFQTKAFCQEKVAFGDLKHSVSRPAGSVKAGGRGVVGHKNETASESLPRLHLSILIHLFAERWATLSLFCYPQSFVTLTKAYRLKQIFKPNN